MIQSVADELDAIRLTTEDDNDGISDKISRLISTLEDAKWEINIEDDMESLRSSNASLRDWGYELLKEIESIES